MNKKFTLLSFVFGLTLLFAIVLQSLDSFYHLEVALTETKCLHEVPESQANIVHGHHVQEHCFVCEFTFNVSIGTDFYTSHLVKNQLYSTNSFFFYKEAIPFFKGSLFSLRGPPLT